MKRIIVTIEGGVVQDVHDVPPGTVVEIRDFDTQGRETKDLPVDAGGHPYHRYEWTNREELLKKVIA